MNFLNNKEFKENLKKYEFGLLTAEEEEQFEEILEKLDEYQAILEAETTGSLKKDYDNFEAERKILKRSELHAYFRISLISLIVSLLLLPTLNLIAMAFNLLP